MRCNRLCLDFICFEHGEAQTHGVWRKISNCISVLPIFIAWARHRVTHQQQVACSSAGQISGGRPGGCWPYMAAQRGTKNSLQTSSLVKASVGFEQSLLLKVRIGAGLFHLPFVLFIFFFSSFLFPAWSLPWQCICKCYLAEGLESGIVNSYFLCL